MTGGATTTSLTGAGFNAGVHGLRGVAALAVVVAHVLGGLAKHVYTDDTGYPAAVEHAWNFGVFFVYIFFAISGFVILPTVLAYRPGDFALRRFIRIYPLFLAGTLAFVILNALTDTRPELRDPVDIFHALTFTNLFAGTEQLTPNAWSLSFEAVFYALACLGCLAWTKGHRGLGLAVAVASLLFLAHFPGAIYFLIGMGAFVAHRRGLVRRLPRRGVAELAVLAILTYVASRRFFAYVPADALDEWAQLTMLFTAAYILLAVEPDSLTARLLSARPAQFLGTISYSLYLVHPYFYLPARLAFDRLGLFGDRMALATGLFGAVVIAGSVALSWLSFLAFERWPQRQVFGARRAPGTRPAADLAGSGA